MPISSVQINEGTGKRYDTWQATKNAVDLQDQFVIPGVQPYPTYSVVIGNIALATAASHLIQVMAGATLVVLVHRIELMELTVPAAVTIGQIQLFRLTAAGTGGGVVTPRPYVTAAAAAGATAMTLPTAKGTEGVQLRERALVYGTAAIPTGELSRWKWEQHPNGQPIVIPAGTANGIAIKNVGGLAAATVSMEIEFTEVNFVPGA